MIIYEINCVKRKSIDAFGINAFENGELVKSVEEITENKVDMQGLVDMCNKLEVELFQLDYIIEDYLTDFGLY